MAPGHRFSGEAKSAFRTVVLQYEAELTALIDLLTASNVSRYLEIGSKFGGSFWRIGMALPHGSRLVAIDLPNGTKEWAMSKESLNSCVASLRENGRDAHVLWGNSTNKDIVIAASELGPYDALLIDGDHHFEGIRKDWENYGSMARIVMFHDIAWKNEPRDRGYRIDVPEFWNQVKHQYKHIEIKCDPTGRDNGIGVLWRG